MRLPTALAEALEAELVSVPQRELAAAAARISERYRGEHGGPGPRITSREERLAYAAVRMPATYAAMSRVLAELRKRAPAFAPRTLLDLGAGPATATFATASAFPQLGSFGCVERDAELAKLGRSLGSSVAIHPEYMVGALEAVPFPPADLVVCSYSLAELEPAAARQVLGRAWDGAQVMIVVEPGTRREFSRLLQMRDAVVARGAHIVAPCPAQHSAATCPMAASGDWCHFPQRVERTALHRRLKGGELPYEDEKFCYFIVAREPITPAAARIVRRPRALKGHVELELCTPSRIAHVTVARRTPEAYKAARRADWGDEWPC